MVEWFAHTGIGMKTERFLLGNSLAKT